LTASPPELEVEPALLLVLELLLELLMEVMYFCFFWPYLSEGGAARGPTKSWRVSFCLNSILKLEKIGDKYVVRDRMAHYGGW
jgi:hypothetical protein